MNRWQAIVFDLDDTLYPEQQYVMSGFNAVATWAESHLGIPTNQGFDELVALFRAGVRRDTFNRWLSEHNISPDKVVPELVKIYRLHTPNISPFPDTPDLLALLDEQHRLGLVSDGYLEVQQRKWAALGLAEHFDAIVFSDELGRDNWKPSIKPFLTILTRLGIKNPDSAVYVGDNPLKDFCGARQIGMSTVWFQRSDSEYGHLVPPSEEYAPDFEVRTSRELIQLLKMTEK